jgi:alpha-1,3-mannosyltransferase
MLSNDTISRERWEKGLPFQVTSCWNGLVVLDASPFYNGVKFRRSKEGECGASECSLLAKDFWEMGKGRALIVPSVKVTYWAAAHQKVFDSSLHSGAS